MLHEMLESHLAHPHDAPLDPHNSLIALESLLAKVERRYRWRVLLRVLKNCASHLVLAGDEDDA